MSKQKLTLSVETNFLLVKTSPNPGWLPAYS